MKEYETPDETFFFFRCDSNQLKNDHLSVKNWAEPPGDALQRGPKAPHIPHPTSAIFVA